LTKTTVARVDIR